MIRKKRLIIEIKIGSLDEAMLMVDEPAYREALTVSASAKKLCHPV